MYALGALGMEKKRQNEWRGRGKKMQPPCCMWKSVTSNERNATPNYLSSCTYHHKVFTLRTSFPLNSSEETRWWKCFVLNLGLDKIEFLQRHENQEIYQKAFELIEHYFGVEEEDSSIAPQVDESQQQFVFQQQEAPMEGFQLWTIQVKTSIRCIHLQSFCLFSGSLFFMAKGRGKAENVLQK